MYRWPELIHNSRILVEVSSEQLVFSVLLYHWVEGGEVRGVQDLVSRHPSFGSTLRFYSGYVAWRGEIELNKKNTLMWAKFTSFILILNRVN